MAAQERAGKTMTSVLEPDEVVNEVRLVGRVSGLPEEKEMPSGDVLVSFRVVVPRPPGARTRTTVDALECVAWSARSRRAVRSWRMGDVVEVSGELRRRFFRTSAGPASRVEVEVTRARIVRRATTG